MTSFIYLFIFHRHQKIKNSRVQSSKAVPDGNRLANVAYVNTGENRNTDMTGNRSDAMTSYNPDAYQYAVINDDHNDGGNEYATPYQDIGAPKYAVVDKDGALEYAVVGNDGAPEYAVVGKDGAPEYAVVGKDGSQYGSAMEAVQTAPTYEMIHGNNKHGSSDEEDNMEADDDKTGWASNACYADHRGTSDEGWEDNIIYDWND